MDAAEPTPMQQDQPPAPEPAPQAPDAAPAPDVEYGDDDALFEEDDELPQGLRVNEGNDGPAPGPDGAALPASANGVPSVLQHPPPGGVTAYNAAMPPLAAADPAAPIKRPRGRPRKVPGTENRPAGSASGSPASRGRPRGSRARGRPRGGRGTGRGRGAKAGGKRGRSSDEEDDFDDDSDSDDDGERGALNLSEEMPDDYNPSGGPTTKFGRKISKPQPFQPTSKATQPRKKRAAAEPHPEAHLLCEVCRLGHSPMPNRLVICESCEKCWHQICHDPAVTDSLVDSDTPWLCGPCDRKIANGRPPVDVNEGHWTSGYTSSEKREWLESLPLHSLIGFVLSVETKYNNRIQPSGMEIWPIGLTSHLERARAAKLAEAEILAARLAAEEAFQRAESEAASTPAPTDAKPSPRLDGPTPSVLQRPSIPSLSSTLPSALQQKVPGMQQQQQGYPTGSPILGQQQQSSSSHHSRTSSLSQSHGASSGPPQHMMHPSHQQQQQQQHYPGGDPRRLSASANAPLPQRQPSASTSGGGSQGRPSPLMSSAGYGPPQGLPQGYSDLDYRRRSDPTSPTSLFDARLSGAQPGGAGGPGGGGSAPSYSAYSTQAYPSVAPLSNSGGASSAGSYSPHQGASYSQQQQQQQQQAQQQAQHAAQQYGGHPYGGPPPMGLYGADIGGNSNGWSRGGGGN